MTDATQTRRAGAERTDRGPAVTAARTLAAEVLAKADYIERFPGVAFYSGTDTLLLARAVQTLTDALATAADDLKRMRLDGGPTGRNIEYVEDDIRAALAPDVRP
jgi:hypothetical protein